MSKSNTVKIKQQPAAVFAPWPAFDDEDCAAVTDILRSGRINYWTGTEGRAFETEYAAHCDANHAVALANGSVALEAALLGLNIGPGDDVIVTSRSFVASAACVLLAGARQVFADVDPDSQNLTADTIRAALTNNTKAVIVVHLAGWPCEMEPIMALARERNFKVIEDCAQAHGASYRGKPVGSMGDVGVFSFCQDKIITTGGEGGMLVTNDSTIWETVWSYKDHGKNFTAANAQSSGHAYRWLHDSAGTNWRMTEMQAALGRRQLRKLPDWTATRRRHATTLATHFKSLPELRVPIPDADSIHAYYKFYVFVEPEKLRLDWNRDRLLAAINAAGVPCFSGSCSEIYKEKAFTGLAPSRPFPNARLLGDTSMMFLVHPTLTIADIQFTCNSVAQICAAARQH